MMNNMVILESARKHFFHLLSNLNYIGIAGEFFLKSPTFGKFNEILAIKKVSIIPGLDIYQILYL